MATRSEVKGKSKGINMAVVMLILVVSGLTCIAVVQWILDRRIAAPSTPQEVHWVEGPAWDLELNDVPEEKIFVGFKYDDRIYMDASELCGESGFRRYVDSGAEQQPDDGWLFQAPDIEFPSKLVDKNWWVIGTDAQPESRVFDMFYQWLSHDAAPPIRSCLFLGKREEEQNPQKFRPNESKPVIGLMGGPTPLDLYLRENEGSIEVNKINRTAMLRRFPWLLAWLHKFSGEGAAQCGEEEFMPISLLLPIEVKMRPDAQKRMHWLAATGCDVHDRWSLVMTNEDGTTSFISLDRNLGTDGYWPTKVWTADIDGDGVPEFLIKAQYYEGESYVLLRLNESALDGYYLTEIAASAYEGL